MSSFKYNESLQFHLKCSQKVALLVLRRVGMCVGHNQMCHLRTGNKIVLKNGSRLHRDKLWAKNKKHRVGMSVGFPVLSIFRFSFLSQWFPFQFSVYRCLFPTLGGNKLIPAKWRVYLQYPQALIICLRFICEL